MNLPSYNAYVRSFFSLLSLFRHSFSSCIIRWKRHRSFLSLAFFLSFFLIDRIKGNIHMIKTAMFCFRKSVRFISIVIILRPTSICRRFFYIVNKWLSFFSMTVAVFVVVIEEKETNDDVASDSKKKRATITKEKGKTIRSFFARSLFLSIGRCLIIKKKVKRRAFSICTGYVCDLFALSFFRSFPFLFEITSTI